MSNELDKLDRAGERIGAFAQAHKGAIPAAVALLVGWAVGANAPKWTFFVVCGVVVLLALWAIWAQHYESKGDK